MTLDDISSLVMERKHEKYIQPNILRTKSINKKIENGQTLNQRIGGLICPLLYNLCKTI